MPNPAMMKFFEFAHLPEKLQAVSKPIGEVAKQMEESLTDSAEKTTGLRKLLEAKDCFVRAALLVLFAVGVLGYAGSASAETPWHPQPMDTWHEGECYRSPHAGGGDSLHVDAPDVTFSVGDLVTAGDLPGQVFSIADKETWHHFKDGRAAHAYYAKDVKSKRGYWLPTSRLVAKAVSKKKVAEWDGKVEPMWFINPNAGQPDPVVPYASQKELAEWKAAYDREQARKAKKAGKKSK